MKTVAYDPSKKPIIQPFTNHDNDKLGLFTIQPTPPSCRGLSAASRSC